MVSQRKCVHLLASGGSIARIGRTRTDYVNYGYKTGIYKIEELLERVPEIHELADLRVEQFANSGSAELGPAEWLELARHLNRVASEDSGVDGIAITHGTATLEETAYFLNLTVKTRKPIVITGSTRPPTAISTDADLNLLDCVRVAASTQAQGKGVLVVMNNEIHAARDVVKTDALRVHTMKSRDLGVLGYADADGSVIFYRHPAPLHTADTEFDVTDMSTLPLVDIVHAYAGADGRLIRALVDGGAKGIVAALLGSGHAPGSFMSALEDAVRSGVKVVVTTQAANGRLLLKQRFIDGGFIAADNLTAKKARVLLMLALAHTADANEIQRMAATY